MDVLSRAWNLFSTIELPRPGLIDFLEIILIAIVIYELLVIVRNTRTWFLIRGILVLLVLVGIANVLRLNTILFIAEKSLSVFVIALVVVFHPELRRALEQLGGRDNALFRLLGVDEASDNRLDADVINEIVKACEVLSPARTGALIVIERRLPLDEYVSTGIDIDAQISAPLLINIFEKNTPLHDGAVIVQGNRLVSATCYLPMSQNKEISKDLGTRHRAAIGVSEVSDSLTVVVSEETGHISVAEKGVLSHDLSLEELRNRLQVLYVPEEKKSFGLWPRKGRTVNETVDNELVDE